jgi:DNA repair protein RecO (recombination protein O)
LNLTKFLGFYPKLVNGSYSYFDLMEGAFTNNKTNTTISEEKLTQFKKILGINFDVIHKVNFSASNRQEVLTILIQYFQLHLGGFKKPKSLNVLKSIFSKR